jgi:hypothetical protein
LRVSSDPKCRFDVGTVCQTLPARLRRLLACFRIQRLLVSFSLSLLTGAVFRLTRSPSPHGRLEKCGLSRDAYAVAFPPSFCASRSFPVLTFSLALLIATGDFCLLRLILEPLSSSAVAESPSLCSVSVSLFDIRYPTHSYRHCTRTSS